MMTKCLGDVSKIELCHLEWEWWEPRHKDISRNGPSERRFWLRSFLKEFRNYLNQNLFHWDRTEMESAYEFIRQFRIKLMRKHGALPTV